MSKKYPEGMGWRISVSILTLFGLMGFIVVWLFFFAGSFMIYQNIAVLLLVVFAFIGLNAAAWAPWGMKQGDWRCECGPEEKPKPRARRARKAVKKR
jgi:hypothetical protein